MNIRETVKFLIKQGHSAEYANKIALDASRGDNFALDWIETLKKQTSRIPYEKNQEAQNNV